MIGFGQYHILHHISQGLKLDSILSSRLGSVAAREEAADISSIIAAKSVRAQTMDENLTRRPKSGFSPASLAA